MQLQKFLQCDSHIGISIAELTADDRLLCNFMCQECLDSSFVFDSPVSHFVSCEARPTYKHKDMAENDMVLN